MAYHYIPLHYITFYYYISLIYITLPYLTLHYIHYMTWHDMTFHYITYIHQMPTCIHAYVHTCLHACMHTCVHAYIQNIGKTQRFAAFLPFSRTLILFLLALSFLTLSTTVAASVYKSKTWLLNFLRRASTKQLGDLLCIDCVRPAGLGFLVATSLLLCTGLDRAQQIDGATGLRQTKLSASSQKMLHVPQSFASWVSIWWSLR